MYRKSLNASSTLGGMAVIRERYMRNGIFRWVNKDHRGSKSKRAELLTRQTNDYSLQPRGAILP